MAGRGGQSRDAAGGAGRGGAGPQAVDAVLEGEGRAGGANRGPAGARGEGRAVVPVRAHAAGLPHVPGVADRGSEAARSGERASAELRSGGRVEGIDGAVSRGAVAVRCHPASGAGCGRVDKDVADRAAGEGGGAQGGSGHDEGALPSRGGGVLRRAGVGAAGGGGGAGEPAFARGGGGGGDGGARVIRQGLRAAIVSRMAASKGTGWNSGKAVRSAAASK